MCGQNDLCDPDIVWIDGAATPAQGATASDSLLAWRRDCLLAAIKEPHALITNALLELAGIDARVGSADVTIGWKENLDQVLAEAREKGLLG
jgi:hypothetical protein